MHVLSPGGFLIGSGKSRPEDFSFFAGACTWAPGQLELEMDQGFWIAANVSPHDITKENQCAFPSSDQSRTIAVCSDIAPCGRPEDRLEMTDLSPPHLFR